CDSVGAEGQEPVDILVASVAEYLEDANTVELENALLSEKNRLINDWIRWSNENLNEVLREYNSTSNERIRMSNQGINSTITTTNDLVNTDIMLANKYSEDK